MASQRAAEQVSSESVHEFLTELFEEDLHAKRVLSLGNAVVGAIHAAALGVSAIGADWQRWLIWSRSTRSSRWIGY